MKAKLQKREVKRISSYDPHRKKEELKFGTAFKIGNVKPAPMRRCTPKILDLKYNYLRG